MNNPATLLTRLDINARFRGLYRWVADEQHLPVLQRGLIAVVVLWTVNSTANTLWALIPSSPVEVSKSVVINPPPSTVSASSGVEAIDVSSILGMSVFGAVEPSGVQDFVPVATVAINGAYNAGLLAAQIVATADHSLRDRLAQYKADLATHVIEKAKKVERASS